MFAIALCAVLSAQLSETITVSRVVVDARVTRLHGEPVTDLTAEDFVVTIAGKRVVVESAEWVDDVDPVGGRQLAVDREAAGPEPAVGASGSGHAPAAVHHRGRLFVLFVQTDFGRNAWRTQGQMKFLQYADELLDTLSAEDRVAVFSFDSHLKFRLDFSSDRDEIRDALRQTLFLDRPPPPPVVPSPSLAPRLDADAMRRAAQSEKGLLLIANALRAIPGPKSILLLGWGLGQRSPAGGVSMKRDWAAARAALDAARVSLFALDTTDADYHDLELGLIAAAEQTGGFYAKTHLYPQGVIDRLQRTLSGHYELTIRTAGDLPPGTKQLSVRVRRRGATVLAPSSIWIR